MNKKEDKNLCSFYPSAAAATLQRQNNMTSIIMVKPLSHYAKNDQINPLGARMEFLDFNSHTTDDIYKENSQRSQNQLCHQIIL